MSVKGGRPIFWMLVACFALWGLLNNMTDNLVPAFQRIFTMDQSRAGLVQVAFYGAYAVLAIFAAVLAEEFSYRKGVLIGLFVYITGALLYIPACVAQSFDIYFVAIFIVAGGCSLLETTCNPYVLSLGEQETAVRRLNFAQMFNPLGSLAGIVLAQQLILAHLDAPRQTALFWVCVPYVGLCAVAALIWIGFFRSKPTEVDRPEPEPTPIHTVLGILFRSPKWCLGVIAQVFYVGVQIAAWTWMNVYCQKELGVTPATAANYYLIALCLFIACRWICTGLMKWFNPARMMALFAFGAILSSLGVMYFPSRVLFTVGSLPFSANVICLCAMSGFMSLMFPTIYGIGLGGIDPRAHKLGAAGLIMAIVGGALLTPWMAAIIDSPGLWARLVPMFDATVDVNLHASSMSLRASFVVPAICFAVVGLYALIFSKSNKE